jgi:hypothetical protein
MNDFEPIELSAPDGRVYRIPKDAKDDWDSWLLIAGDKWTAPLYAKVVFDGVPVCQS